MNEYENEKPQQLVLIEFSKEAFEKKFYQLRLEGYRATQVSTSQSTATNCPPNNTFIALMEF